MGKQLSQSLAGLADVERKAQDLQSVQSEQDMTTLMATGIIPFFFPFWLVLISEETVDEYARLINSVRVRVSLLRIDFLYQN